jgi:hypothetical protein
MKEEKLNYEAHISCYNSAFAKFNFHGDNLELAEAHVNHLLKAEVDGYEWSNSPSQIHYICFRKIGTKKWRYHYNREYDPNIKAKSLPELMNENRILKEALKKAIEWLEDLGAKDGAGELSKLKEAINKATPKK